jgi:hypothetical protein
LLSHGSIVGKALASALTDRQELIYAVVVFKNWAVDPHSREELVQVSVTIVALVTTVT